MSDIKLAPDETEFLVSKVKKYFQDELDQDIGAFEAEFLIDFMAKELGPKIYNRAILDAHALFAEKTEELGYLLQELEKPDAE